jgi:hypothetical protein
LLRYSGIVFSRVSGDKTEEACREIKAAAYVEKSERGRRREVEQVVRLRVCVQQR